MADDESVLGNLPRSRPGRRSGKRDQAASSSRPADASERAAKTTERSGKPDQAASSSRPADASERAAETAERSGEPAAEPSRESRATYRSRTTGATPPPREPERDSNPVGDAVQLAGKVAGTGVRVAGGIARELVRRLPRP